MNSTKVTMSMLGGPMDERTKQMLRGAYDERTRAIEIPTERT